MTTYSEFDCYKWKYSAIYSTSKYEIKKVGK